MRRYTFTLVNHNNCTNSGFSETHADFDAALARANEQLAPDFYIYQSHNDHYMVAHCAEAGAGVLDVGVPTMLIIALVP